MKLDQPEFQLASPISHLSKYFWLTSMLPMQHVGTDMSAATKDELKQTYDFIRGHFDILLGAVVWKEVAMIPDFDFWEHGVSFFQLTTLAFNSPDTPEGEAAKMDAASILVSYYALVGL